MYPPWEELTVSSRHTCTLLYSVASTYLGLGWSLINATFSRLGGMVAVEIICAWRTLFSSQSSQNTDLCDV